MTSIRVTRSVASIAAIWLVVAPGRMARAAEVETFVGTTANMTPADLELQIDILRWSTDADREAAVSAVTAARDAQASAAAGGNTDDGDAKPVDVEALFGELPTLGYVWTENSGVGYMVKYAHRSMAADGGVRITLITGQPLGTYSREPWRATGSASDADAAFTVIELRLDRSGMGNGTMSLAAEIAIDDMAHTVSLRTSDSTPVLLSHVKRESGT